MGVTTQTENQPASPVPASQVPASDGTKPADLADPNALQQAKATAQQQTQDVVKQAKADMQGTPSEHPATPLEPGFTHEPGFEPKIHQAAYDATAPRPPEAQNETLRPSQRQGQWPA